MASGPPVPLMFNSKQTVSIAWQTEPLVFCHQRLQASTPMNPQLTEKRTEQADQKRSLSFATMVRAMRRHPILLLLALAAAGGAAAAVDFFPPPPKPVAYAIFQIKSQPDFFMKPSGDAKIDFNIYRQAQANLIKNRLVLNNAISQPEVKDCSMLRSESDPVNWLENQLKVDFKAGTEYMNVSLEGDNAEESRKIVAAVTNAYLKEVVHKDKSDRAAEFARKLKTSREYEENLAKKRTAIVRISRELTTSDPAVAGAIEKVGRESIAEYKKELAKLEVDVVSATKHVEYYKKRIEAAKDQPVPEMRIESALKESPVYHELLIKQQMAQKSLDDLKASLPANDVGSDPKLAEKRLGLQRVTDEMDNYKTTMRPVVIEKLRNQAILQEKQKIESLQESIDLNSLRRQAVDEYLQKFNNEDVKPFKNNQIQLEQLKADVAQTEKMVDRILADLESMKPDLLDSPSRVTIWQEPVAVSAPKETRPVEYRLAAGIAVFTIGIGLIFAFDRRYRRVTHTDEVVGQQSVMPTPG
jgi:succinoglycan biosynthesis transport protein ExoP